MSLDLDRVVAGDLELRQSGAAVADEHHVHRQAAAALLDEVLLAVREDLALALAGREVLEEDPEALGVDADAVAHRLELELALDGTRVIELDVPRHDLRGAVQRAIVAHGHHVVEAVDADALAPNLVGEPFARRVDEDLLVDPRRSVLADVRRLAREDDRRLALARQQHVGVAVHDHEAGHVGDGSLEAGVLVAGDDHRVEAVARHRLANAAVPAIDLLLRHHCCCQAASTPFTSAQIESCAGVGTPSFRPNSAMPPFR